MEHTNYAARLRYLDADDIDDAVVDYDGMDVRGPNDEKLGDLDGFIVDADAGRVYYVVVDTGGWFRSRQLLLPVGHATLDADRKALRVDVTKDALGRYPDFDDDQFRRFSDEDLRRFDSRTVEACCPDDVVGAGPSLYDSRRHYTQPAWWGAPRYSQDRLRSRDTSWRRGTAAVTGAPAPASTVSERYDREHVVAHDATEGTRRADPTDVSPHYGGRAQPGDVLGIETGGEVTRIGDDAEAENKRRRDAERAAADEPPRRSDR